MTNGEKMIWAAAYADSIGNFKCPEDAATYASSVVRDLRNHIQSQSYKADYPTGADWRVKEMLGV